MPERSHTALRTLQRLERRAARTGSASDPAPEHWRPQTRSDCAEGPRPCPYYGCRYHLGLDVTYSGSIRMPFGEALDEMPETCALDVAEQGGHELYKLATLMNYNKERARQLVLLALESLSAKLACDEDLAKSRRQSPARFLTDDAVCDESE